MRSPTKRGGRSSTGVRPAEPFNGRCSAVHTVLRGAIALVVLVGAAACSDFAGVGGDEARRAVANAELARSVATAELEHAARGRRERGPEDEILRLENEVPGVGGFFLDPNSRKLTVFSQAPEQDSRVAEAARNMLQRVDIAGDVEGVEVVRGTYGFSRLVAWQKLLRGQLANMPGFLAIDADERANRIRIRVASASDRSTMLQEVERAGVDVNAVEVDVSAAPRSLATLDSKFRPAGAGVKFKPIGSGTDCTMGWAVSTNQGEKGFLTASQLRFVRWERGRYSHWTTLGNLE